MSILTIKRDEAYESYIVRMTCDDTLQTITTAGYITDEQENIKSINNGQFEWLETDMILIYHSEGVGFFTRNATKEAFSPVVNDGGLVTFNPTVTFGTPGNLSVAYSFQSGVLIKTGQLKVAHIVLSFTPTHTTASGNFIITGIPEPVVQSISGIVNSHNVTLAYPSGTTTLVASAVSGSSNILLKGLGTVTATANLTITQITTATAFIMDLTVFYV